VITESFTKTVEIEGKKCDLQCFGQVTTYANGTKTFRFSVTIQNIAPMVPKLRMNFTKVVTSEELSYYKEGNKETQRLKSSSDETLITTSDQLDEYRWDNIYSVAAPGNETIWIKYDHDNNYWRYWPMQFNLPWEIPIGIYGNQKIHTHMAVSDVYDWKTGAKTDEEIAQKYMTLGSSVAGSFIGAFLGSAVVSFLSLTGGWAAVVVAVCAAFGAFIAWLLAQLGISNKADWIENVVEAEQGDGFYWSWDFKTTAWSSWIYPGYKMWGSPVTEVWMHMIRECKRTYGVDRDGNPEIWQVELWLYNIWNAAVGIR
jgi:VIT1/CCC1 family predicted Fe2+/Mn2+ transporter